MTTTTTPALANELKAMRAAAEKFCAEHLPECAAELHEWQSKGALRDGKLRQLGELCEKYVGQHDGLKVAERMVEFDSVAALARRAAQPVAPVQAPSELEKALRELMSIVRIHSHDIGENFAWAEMQYAKEVLATPSPQVAEGAELPLPWGDDFEAWLEVRTGHEVRTEIRAYIRDAIATSRRAAGGEVVMPRELAQRVYDRLCKAQIFPLAGEVRKAMDATPAPASAGQASTGKTALFAVNILGGPMREYAPGKWESAVWPSEGAGQAGQVANGGLTTLLQAAGAMRLVRCHDGSGEPFAAYDKEIADRVVADLRAEMHALEVATERAAAPADHKCSFAADGYCLGCDAKEPQPEEKGSK